MANNYKVLFVIEHDSYAIPLKEKAFLNYNFELVHYNNWEDALLKLDAEFESFHAVIIDGTGKLTKNGKSSNPMLVAQATADLRERKGRNQVIPFAILSEYTQIKEFIIDQLFEKTDDGEDELFNYLIEEIKNAKRYKIRYKYRDAFQAFGDGYLDDDAEENLYEVLSDFEENNWSSNSFIPLRKIIESVYFNLHEKDDDLIPYMLVRYKDKVNFTFCERRLSGQKIENPKNRAEILWEAFDKPAFHDHLSLLIGPVTKVCHKACHRNYAKNLNIFTLGTIVYGVMDMLVWYKKYVDENFRDDTYNPPQK